MPGGTTGSPYFLEFVGVSNMVKASKEFDRLNKMEHAEVLWTSVLRQTSDENAMGGARGGVIDFRGFHRSRFTK